MARTLGSEKYPARSANPLVNTKPTYPAAVATSVAVDVKTRMLKSRRLSKA